MRRRWLGMVAVTAALMGAPAAPASAGGWWSYVHVDGHDFGVGETVIATTEAYFPTAADAEEGRRTDYFAYVVSAYDRALLAEAQGRANPSRWWSVPASATLRKVGRVQFHTFDDNIGHAVARMTIPRLRPGRYFFMFCDEGCRQPFASSVPSHAVRITRDPVAARAARRAEALAEHTQAEVADLRAELRVVKGDAEQARATAAVARDGQRALALAAARDDSPLDRGTVAWAFVAGMALSALVVGAGLVWSRRRSARRERDRWRPPPPGQDARSTFEMAAR